MHIYLGLDHEDKFQIYVSGWGHLQTFQEVEGGTKLEALQPNQISPMHKRGREWPRSLIELIDGDQSKAMDALRDVTNYYRQADSGKNHARKQPAKPKPRVSVGKFPLRKK